MAVEELFQKLEEQLEGEEYNEALETSDAILAEESDNAEASKSKVYCLTNLSKWEDVIGITENNKEFGAERAYALYRLNRYEEAKKMLNGLNHPIVQALEPQIDYRMGEYTECVDYYKNQLKTAKEDRNALAVNLLASMVSGEPDQKELIPVAKEFLNTSYETNFNLACGYLDTGALDQAMDSLDEARAILVKDLKEDDKDADIDNNREIAVIDIQRAVVWQRQGQLEQAHQTYDRILKIKPEDSQGEIDITALAVAANNLTSLRDTGKNLFDSLKQINKASKESLADKLTVKQTISIGVNKVILLVQAKRIKDAKEQLSSLQSKYADNPRVKIAEACVAHGEKKPKKVEEILKTSSSPLCVLALAQLYATQGDHQKASDMLEKLGMEERTRSDILDAILSLRLRKNDIAESLKILKDAIAFVEKKNEGLEGVLRVAMKWVGKLKSQEFAASIYRQFLEQVDGTDARALSGLAEYATDPEEALQYVRKLKVPSWKHIDAEELELMEIPKIVRKKKDDKKGDVNVPKKRKNKIRYPKNFDPAKPGPPPNPERWLPKYERAEYKKRMAKKNKGLIRGPQGSSVGGEEVSKNKGPSTAHVEVASSEVPRKRKGKKR